MPKRITKVTLWIISVSMMAAAIVLFILSAYIASEVDDGRKQAKSAQDTVDFAKSVTDSNKYTKGFGDFAAQPVQKKIDKGYQDIDTYTRVANIMMVLAICLISVGAILFFVPFFIKSKKR